MFKYETNVDGRVYVESEVELEKDMLLIIKEDGLEYEEKEVFKVRSISGKNVDLKFQKVANLIESESGSFLIDGVKYDVPNNRLNKNQMILVGNKVGTVSDIEKRKGEANLVSVEWLDLVTVEHKFRIYKQPHGGGKEIVDGVYNSYAEAIIKLSKDRDSRSNEGYFRFK